MSNHITYIKSMVEQPVEVAKKEVEASGNRHSVKKRSSFGLKTAVELEGRVIQVLEETLKNPATAQMIIVDKIYAFTPEGGDYCQLGWVHRSAISRCMVCNLKFGLMGKKYNCTACGYVICAKCSPQSAMIAELKSNERFRVCRRCFTGAKKLYALPHLQTVSNNNDADLGSIEEKEPDLEVECKVMLDYIISTLEEEAVNPKLAAAREVLQKIILLNPQQLQEFERFISREDSVASATGQGPVGSFDEFGTSPGTSPHPGRSMVALRFITAMKNAPANNRSLYAIDTTLALSSDNRDPLPRPMSTAALMSPKELQMLEAFFGREDPLIAEGEEGKKKKGKKGHHKKEKKGHKKRHKSHDDDTTISFEGHEEGKGIAISSEGDKATKAAEKKARMKKALKKIANSNSAVTTLAAGGQSKSPATTPAAADKPPLAAPTKQNSNASVVSNANATTSKPVTPIVATASVNHHVRVNHEFDDISVLSGDSVAVVSDKISGKHSDKQSSPRVLGSIPPSARGGVDMSREPSVARSDGGFSRQSSGVVRSSNLSRQNSGAVRGNVSRQGSNTASFQPGPVLSPHEMAVGILSRDDTPKDIRVLEPEASVDEIEEGSGANLEVTAELEGDGEVEIADDDEESEVESESDDYSEDDDDDDSEEEDDEDEDAENDAPIVVTVDPGVDAPKTNQVFCSLESCIIS